MDAQWNIDGGQTGRAAWKVRVGVQGTNRLRDGCAWWSVIAEVVLYSSGAWGEQMGKLQRNERGCAGEIKQHEDLPSSCCSPFSCCIMHTQVCPLSLFYWCWTPDLVFYEHKTPNNDVIYVHWGPASATTFAGRWTVQTRPQTQLLYCLLNWVKPFSKWYSKKTALSTGKNFFQVSQ